ncbi:hypothetical protein A176_006162 [Myxococcus hansupus]|uniref:DUF3592 domain-containing protein n=1 Tax=Pseudomyxococcus hansupus TaxID=1297742 RepID=A0A0H4X6M9_9BACT|nr:hypothetical protein [Myxococcus hansupus]AKQ69250.1 hypothetical protein A176_006162 [Myxococcus hansupus]
MLGHDNGMEWALALGAFAGAMALIAAVILRRARRTRVNVWTQGQRARARLVKAEPGVRDRNREPTTLMTFQVDDLESGTPWLLVQQRTLRPEHARRLVPGMELEIRYLPEARYSAVVIPMFDEEESP